MKKYIRQRKKGHQFQSHFRVRIPKDLISYFQGTQVSQNKLTEICLQKYLPKNETVLELNQLHLSPEVKSAIRSLSTQIKCSLEETLEMSLREHFCLPIPQRWMKESWVQGGVVLEGE